MGEITDSTISSEGLEQSELDDRKLNRIHQLANLLDRVFEADHKSSREIQRDIEQTRADMNETISEIRSRLMFGELATDAFDFTRAKWAEKSPDVTGLLRRNPGPLALVAGSIGWLLFRELPFNGQTEGRVKERVSDIAETVGEKARGVMDSMKEKTSGTFQTTTSAAKEKMSRVSDRITSGTRTSAIRARDTFSDSLQTNPLTVGAMALAVGAVCGLAVPLTHKEKELVDRATDEIKQDMGLMSQKRKSPIESYESGECI